MTEVTTAPSDTGCRALADLSGLKANVLHRFVVGRDHAPQVIDPTLLGDPFARLVLAVGPPPRTADEVAARINGAFPDGDPRARERSFLVGEGSQLPAGALAAEARSVRFVIVFGTDPVDVVLSATSAESSSVELMAWDSERTGFNFYGPPGTRLGCSAETHGTRWSRTPTARAHSRATRAATC